MTIDWQAVGAVATAGAALVALVPIFRGFVARRSKARNLRIRLAVKIMQLRPSVARFLANPARDDPHFLELSNQQLRQLADQLEMLLAEGECLSPKEQDRVSQVVANLQLMLPAMEVNQLPPDGAKSLLDLCDQSIALMEEHGLLHGEPEQPWAQ